jgi:hypothetical protein
MIDQPKRKGGRPPLPDYVIVTDSATCRVAITRELMAQNRDRQLKGLYKLLKAFERGEQAARDERTLTAKENANRIAAERLAVTSAEHRRRMANGSLGVKVIEQQKEKIAVLQARVQELENELTGTEFVVESGRGLNAECK